MTKIRPEPDAVYAFVRTLTDRAYNGAIKGMAKILSEGPPGRGPRPNLVQMHLWYARLGPADQQTVMEIIRETVRQAVFGCFVVIDNAQGGYAAPDVLSDYAVYLQMYSDEDAQSRNEFESAIRLNPAYSAAPDLHDVFMALVESDGAK